jgi:hypothetical protein
MQAQRRNSSLPDSWIQQLDAIGFQWTADDERWEYFLAVQTKDLKGRAARAYLHRLEQAFLTGTLPEARRLALEQLGVPWASGDAARAHMVRRLELLAKKVGEKGVRANLSLDRELKDWVRAQRDRVASGQLDPALLTPLERRVLASGSAAAKPARTATNVPRSRGRAHR